MNRFKVEADIPFLRIVSSLWLIKSSFIIMVDSFFSILTFCSITFLSQMWESVFNSSNCLIYLLSSPLIKELRSES